MKKPHFESICEMFPKLVEYSFKRDAQKTGVLSQLQLVSNWIKDHSLINKDYQLMDQIASNLIVFNNDGAKIFKMAREFSEALLNVKLDIPAIHLPKNDKIICIEFAENMRFNLQRDFFAHCAYVYVTDERTITNNGTLAKNLMTITIPLYNKDGVLQSQMDFFSIPFTSLDQTFEEAIDKADRFSTVFANKDLLRFVLNCYIYVHSGDPDLREYRAPKRPKSKNVKKNRIWLRAHLNQSLMNMTLVGFDYKKPAIYSVDSTVVRAHARWQPYGEARSKVKLIFIESHVRKYKNEPSDLKTNLN